VKTIVKGSRGGDVVVEDRKLQKFAVSDEEGMMRDVWSTDDPLGGPYESGQYPALRWRRKNGGDFFF
jgi:hypothetical protein